MPSDVVPGPDGPDVVSIRTADDDGFVAVFDDGAEGRTTPPIRTTFLHRTRARAIAYRVFLKRK